MVQGPQKKLCCVCGQQQQTGAVGAIGAAAGTPPLLLLVLQLLLVTSLLLVVCLGADACTESSHPETATAILQARRVATSWRGVTNNGSSSMRSLVLSAFRGPGLSQCGRQSAVAERLSLPKTMQCLHCFNFHSQLV
jgi:hypothetical protein